MSIRGLFSYVLLALFVQTPAFASPQLLTGNGFLLGANGVLVDGASYDVRFQDGTCADVFPDCLSAIAFPFGSGESALSATDALIQQVFKDGGLKLTNPPPFITSGCLTWFDCRIQTPFQIDSTSWVTSIVAIDYWGTPSIGIGQLSMPVYFDTTDYKDRTWAVWTVSAVPEPESYALMLAGLGVIGAVARRRKKKVIVV